MRFDFQNGKILFFLLSVISIFAVFLTLYFVEESSSQVFAFIIIALILILSFKTSLSDVAQSEATLRRAFWVFLTFITFSVSFRPFLNELLFEILGTYFPDLISRVKLLSSDTPTYSLVLLAFAAYTGLLWVKLNESALRKIPLDNRIKQPDYLERRQAFINDLADSMQTMDRQLRWQRSHYINLTAEVELLKAGRTHRRIGDLVKALTKQKSSNLLLVLGQPGAGKSVALRKCCFDLLQKVTPNEQIPIYINLKEWSSSYTWGLDSLPQQEEFSKFIRENIRGQLSDWNRIFFDEHFERMILTGEIFFLFDSFDEIPGLLDADENSKTLLKVTNIVVGYLKAHPNSRAILSSRYYRRPRLQSSGHTTLEIRPFSETQIIQAIRKVLGSTIGERLITELFSKRPELGAAAKNPFALGLILQYWQTNRTFPDNQSELFENFIALSLKDAEESMQELGITRSEVEKAMSDISWSMFESENQGLEMRLDDLQKLHHDINIEKVARILTYARLARVTDISRKISFVHRRFNEFFLIKRWIEKLSNPPLDSIPNDSRFRDALVLYAEIAPQNVIKNITRICWSEIKKFDGGNLDSKVKLTQFLRSMHSLRFLVEAFRTKPEVIVNYRKLLDVKVREIILNTDDLLVTKTIVEASGLLGDEMSETVLTDALESKNTWIQETAFRACRYRTKLPESTLKALKKYFNNRPYFWHFKLNDDHKTSINSADVFEPINNYLKKKRNIFLVSLTVPLALLISVLIVSPKTVAIFTSITFISSYWLYLYLTFMKMGLEKMRRDFKPQVNFIRKKLEAKHSHKKRHFNADRKIIFFKKDLIFWFPTLFQISFLTTTIAIYFRSSFDIYLLGKTEKIHIAISSIFGDAYQFWGQLPFGLSPEMNFILVLALSILTSSLFLGIIFGVINLKFTLPRMIYFCIIIPMTPAVIFNFYLFLQYLPKWLLTILVIIPISTATLGIIIICLSGFYSKIKDEKHDKSHLKVAENDDSVSRTIIAEHFNLFKTQKFRIKYVEYLKVISADEIKRKELNSIAQNPWPDGKVPNINQDISSTMLAQLNASWLNLDL